jgi:hypothetical protein
MKTRTSMTFAQWLSAVDAWLLARIGMVSADLPDCCYRDWFEDGVTPRQAASRALRNARDEL